MNIGTLSGWVAVLAILAGLGTTATIIALGFQRGRVERLESTNNDLRKEIEDEKRRHATTRSEFAVAKETAARDRDVIDHLKAEVRTMQGVFEAVSGPIHALTTAMVADHDLLAAHHQEAMSRLQGHTTLLIDVLRMSGDQRSPEALHLIANPTAPPREHRATGAPPHAPTDH